MAIPVDSLPERQQNVVEYILHCIATQTSISGPLDPALSLIGQRIIDTAVLSASQKRTIGLLP